jgi:carboxymethylenebutenolidase
MDVRSGWVDLPAEGGRMAAYVAEPVGPGPFPALVYFHVVLGINQQHRGMAERIASEGYVVVMPDMYHRTGYRQEFRFPEEREKAFQTAATVSQFGIAADSRVALNYLRERPNVDAGRLGVVGYCGGGTMAFLAACFHRDVKAAAVMYGTNLVTAEVTPRRPVRPLDLAENIQGPVLLISGNGDRNPSPADVKIAAATMEKLGKSFEHHIYQGDPPAGHAFFDADIPQLSHPAAAAWGWPIKLDFLKRHLQAKRS